MRVTGHYWLERRMNACCAALGLSLAGRVRLQAVPHAVRRLRDGCRAGDKLSTLRTQAARVKASITNV